METLKLKIPEDISDITLEQYQKYHKLTERDNLDEYSFNKRLVHIFCNIPYQKVDKVGIDDFSEVVGMIKKAIEQESEFKQRFFLNNVEYGFIPNLDKMTTKEYYDLSSYGLDVDNLHKIMAILFRPIKEKDKFGNYSIVEYNGDETEKDIMLQMPMNVVNGALVFFSSLAKELRIAIQKYSEKVQEKVNKLRTISENGVGM